MREDDSCGGILVTPILVVDVGAVPGLDVRHIELVKFWRTCSCFYRLVSKDAGLCWDLAAELLMHNLC